MFNDGQNTSLNRLTRQFGTTFSLSVELAILSIIIVGLITHWLVPHLSLPLAIALGAIITPTDAVAVSSITDKLVVPNDVMSTLENESLFNDASGIVALNLAITAAVTGQFSVIHGISNFIYVFFGGIIIGTVLGAIIVGLRLRFIKMNVDAPSVLVPFTLLTPFIVYLIAESLGVSGILAVVMTGLLHGIQQDRLRLTSSRVQIIMSSTWSVVSSLLNGIVFVLLGLSLPIVMINITKQRGSQTILKLIGIAIFLYLVMTLLRYLWTKLDFAHIPAFDRHEKTGNSFIMALTGVHGTITLAMALSLPLTLNGKTFIYRNDIIFIASIVIITSLIIPTVILPIFLPKEVSSFTQDELRNAKDEMITDAIKLITSKHQDTSSASLVVQILEGQRIINQRGDRNKLSKLFDKCFEIEKDTIEKMEENNEISSETANIYVKIAERSTIQFQESGWQRLALFIKYRIWGKFSPSKTSRNKRKKIRQHQKSLNFSKQDIENARQELWNKIGQVETKPYQNVIKFLNEQYSKTDDKEISIVRTAYDQRHRRLIGEQEFIGEQDEILLEAFQQEYNFIQSQVASKRYSHELGKELNEQVSTDRLVYLQAND